MAANNHQHTLNRRFVPPEHHSPAMRDGGATRVRAASTGAEWTRVMHTMTGFGCARAVRFVGRGYMRPLGQAAVEFLLQKAAATVVPVQVYLQAMCLSLVGDQISAHASLRDTGTGGVIHDAGGAGAVVWVVLFDRDRKQIAWLCGQRDQCLAWRTLVEWTLLRDATIRER